jgi:hypothetical protein
VRIRLTRGNGVYALPGSAVLAGTLLLSLGLIVAAASRGTQGPVTCPFRVVMVLPCPTCGMVRATGHVMRGEFLAALMINPLDALAILLGTPAVAALFVANRVGGWRLALDLSGRERRAAWVFATAIVAANWAYVLSRGV